jgi:hypothetical protein
VQHSRRAAVHHQEEDLLALQGTEAGGGELSTPVAAGASRGMTPECTMVPGRLTAWPANGGCRSWSCRGYRAMPPPGRCAAAEAQARRPEASVAAAGGGGDIHDRGGSTPVPLPGVPARAAARRIPGEPVKR